MRTDAVVVGLGAAGCQAAKDLTARGLSVVALEAGRMLDAGDLPAEIRPVGHWRRPLLGRHRVQARSISYHPRVEHLYVDDRKQPYGTAGGDPFLWIRGRQVGGRLHTWAGMALRLSEADLRRAEEDGYGIPWPLSYAELAPYYDAVETFHGLRGARDGLAHLPDGRVTEAVELEGPARILRRHVEERWPERRVIAPRTLVKRIDPIPAPLRAAMETGRLRIVANAAVARVAMGRDGRHAVAVEYVDTGTGAVGSVPTDRVFLCASSIESVRVLLNSRSRHHPGGLGNRHDQLGRYILDHNFVVASGVTGEEYRASAADWSPRVITPLDLGAQLDFYVPDFGAASPERNFVRGFGIQGRISPTHWGMGAFGEMLPHPDNRVTLGSRTDAHGIPVVNISVRRRENDLQMIAAQKVAVREIAAAAGLLIRMPLPGLVRGLLWRLVGPEIGVMHLGIAIHETGGARMGDDPRRSVLDPDHRVWDTENLHVTDGACFPGTGCQNPTLTIMALTARACARVAGGSVDQPPRPRSAARREGGPRSTRNSE